MNSDFTLEGETLPITDDVRAAFNENGYILVREFLKEKEVALLKEELQNSSSVEAYNFYRKDHEGRQVCSLLWSDPGDDVIGRISRSNKAVSLVESLLGGAVYIYHIKLTTKAAKTGGTFTWHQDYGYWYEHWNLRPTMGSLFIAVDKTTRQNGCLKLLEGSHHMGRMNHVLVGTQVAAEPQRVEMAATKFKLRYLEMAPGDAVFFHSNVLHSSEKNTTENSRTALIVAYNRDNNSPVAPKDAIIQKPKYTEPLKKIPNHHILEAPKQDLAEKQFYDFAGYDKLMEKVKQK